MKGFGFELVTGPAAEPITLAEAKLFLKVDNTADDALITALIVAARTAAENYMRRALITQEWNLYLDSIPYGDRKPAWWDGTREGSIRELYGYAQQIEIPKPPVQQVIAMTTTDLSNAETTFDSSNYFVDTKSEPARLILNFGCVWPVNLRYAKSVKINFKAGYGDTSASIPADIIHAIKILTLHLYDNRGILNSGSRNVSAVDEIPYSVSSLLEKYRVLRL